MHDWDPPWPPIQISDCEWVILRNHWIRPAAVVRRIDAVDGRPARFRVVTWAPTSEGRELVVRQSSTLYLMDSQGSMVLSGWGGCFEMANFSVDVEGLEGVSDRVAAAIEPAHGQRASAPDANTTGHGRLSASAANFVDHWNTQTDNADDKSNDVRRRLVRAAALYQTADRTSSSAAKVLDDVVPESEN